MAAGGCRSGREGPEPEMNRAGLGIIGGEKVHIVPVN